MKKIAPILGLVLLLTGGSGDKTEIIQNIPSDQYGRYLVQQVQIDGRGKDKQDKIEACFDRVEKWTEYEVDKNGKKTKIKDKTLFSVAALPWEPPLSPIVYFQIETALLVPPQTGNVSIVIVTNLVQVTNLLSILQPEYVGSPYVARVHKHTQWLPPFENQSCPMSMVTNNVGESCDDDWKEWLK